jgi:hypothetical protein
MECLCNVPPMKGEVWQGPEKTVEVSGVTWLHFLKGVGGDMEWEELHQCSAFLLMELSKKYQGASVAPHFVHI